MENGLGNRSNKLIRDSKRTQYLDYLPPYQADTVNDVVNEIRAADRESLGILQNVTHEASQPFQPQDHPSEAAALLMFHSSSIYNKRCLMAYHNLRLQRLRQYCWSGGKRMESCLDTSLSTYERDYLTRYSELLAAYKGAWSELDLTGSLVPPKNLFIDVRVLKDVGDIETEYGTINLTKNSQLHVRATDVERLIAQGFLAKL
ncbi:DNA replication complex GINS protein psf1 [Schizosaccharomyces pombe]|uniref:DNA replication complex GINS protein psf1 n=1 Tax=Schizosaccharomyces pombe (strain 972 / ATCC 24843) TaxID=284812 RepID=PSF1_SCHPO|nr:GINS complex subunit Psf1 [Schizosaccharomyces pombe]Q9P7X6.1 RecName: Full=DNA replication complex GINS protein psf1 [Schizosaccharomyces pombe 972h-]CAB66437.1 GINS complex subunit Psf1 [Schizosaccharomyces pombe]|eukprot:NP_595821.1 GINS complex subunit Psf1 [Schizosaccharomyces pombe]